jgi:hypothetical protein
MVFTTNATEKVAATVSARVQTVHTFLKEEETAVHAN